MSVTSMGMTTKLTPEEIEQVAAAGKAFRASVYHPSDDAKFNRHSTDPIWYLAHPVASDEVKTIDQNLADILHLMRLFTRQGVKVQAPYYTLIQACEDNEPEIRLRGMEINLRICRTFGTILLTGHKVSKGMRDELDAATECKQGGVIFNFIGMSNAEIIAQCPLLRTFHPA